jgi:Kdo2-lipid IVA lauroyltransferase/acyltransferase
MPRGNNSRMQRLLRSAEGVAYWAAAAPLLARLPAPFGYRIACWHGDWLSRWHQEKRAELARNLRQVLGDELDPAAAHQVTREWFRLASCTAVDVNRLRQEGQALRRLVTIRGQGHLEAALAAGKGAIVCSAHFGSFDCAFSMLGASGFPVTTIGRWQHMYTADLSSAERWFWDLAYARRLRRHRRRPNIEPWSGRFDVAALAAAVLRANEVLTVTIDAPPLDSDRDRAVEVPFLGRRVTLLPGVVTIAQLTGAPLLMGFLYRSADYRHQVLEISAPVQLGGDAVTAFGRCAAEMSAAIQKNPAHWVYWASTADLAEIGLISPALRQPAQRRNLVLTRLGAGRRPMPQKVGGLPDSARAAAGQFVGPGRMAGFFTRVGGQISQRALDLLPHPAERDPEHALAALQQVHDLVGRRAGVHARTIAHERDLGQVAGAMLAEVGHGRPDLLQ